MKRLALALLLLSGPALAADRVSLVFERVALVELARIAYGELQRVPFVLTSEALAAQEVVTVDLRNVERAQAIAEVSGLLEGAGFVAHKRSGVVWIGKPKADDEMEMLYRPRHRSATYLTDLLAPLFKPGSFGQQRAVQNSYPAMPVQYGKGQPVALPMPVDSGTSAYSLIDKAPDVVIFKGTAKDHQRLAGILGQLDTPTPELLVKAVVFEVSTEDKEQSALALAVRLAGGKLGLSIGKAAAGDYSIVFKGTSLDLVATALSSDRRFRVVSSPTLRVRSGSNAKLTVGSETPVLGQAQIDRNGNPIQSVEYRPSGVILDLKPSVREEVAELQINQQISNFIPTTTGVSGSPTLIKRELSTSVGVGTNEILVLGGLDEEKSSEDQTSLSFLPRFLRASGSEKSRSEVLLLLQAERI